MANYEVDKVGILRRLSTEPFCDCKAVGLVNGDFQSTSTKTSRFQIDEWCKQNKVVTSSYNGTDSRGKKCHFMRFSRS